MKEFEFGHSVNEVRRELGANTQTFYCWKKKKNSGMDGYQLKHLKELEEENRRLKTMYADLVLANKILKDVLSTKYMYFTLYFTIYSRICLRQQSSSFWDTVKKSQVILNCF